MISVRRLGSDNRRVWCAVRLDALGQAPGAFGSTLAYERRFTESDWRDRLGPGGVKVVATLVTEVVDWARKNGWSRVVLDVADGNDAARRLFLRNGFEPTGQRAPLPNNPAVETEMLARKVS